METVNVNITQQPYSVYIGSDIFNQFAAILRKHYQGRQIAIITSRFIFELHGKEIIKQLKNKGKVITLFVPDGESSKSIEQTQHLYTHLLKKKFERGALIIALGGGVIGDLAGFVAATYLRGVPFVQIPTTLLAQVDSSVGGKVGINHNLGKNLIGAFKQPLFVFSDIALLKTLKDSELRCGLGEAVKYGFIQNRSFFEYFDQNLDRALEYDTDVLLKMVKTSVQSKADVVEKDEKEQNLRMILNFGHTFGHALEKLYGFSGVKHGEGVILGMACALEYSRLKNDIAEDDYKAGIALLKRFPVQYELKKIDIDKLLNYMTLDKKVKDNKIRLVLVPEIGRYYIEKEADLELIKEAYKVII